MIFKAMDKSEIISELAAGSRTLVMGIINATPDSFSDGGKNFHIHAAMQSVRRMVEAGVDIVDVGGESTRPGSARVDAGLEIARTIPLIKEIAREFPWLAVSIDTYKAEVAEAAVEAGAAMLNDISALRLDAGLAAVAAGAGIPICIMHMLGTPETMQSNPEYENNVCDEINAFFKERIAAAVGSGIRMENIIIDPGIGFGKTVEHNLEIIDRLKEFQVHGRPVLVGASRKSFIGKTLDVEVGDRLEGSIAAAVISVVNGAGIVRVHDVEETVRAVRMADAIVRKPSEGVLK